MTELEAIDLVRFVVWLVVGLVIYFFYGRTHSRLQRGEEPELKDPEPDAAL